MRPGSRLTNDSSLGDGVTRLRFAAARAADALCRRWRWLAASLALCLATGGSYVALAPCQYIAEASLLVWQTGSEDLSTSMSPESVTSGLMPTYQRLLTSSVVLDRAIAALAEEHRCDWQHLPAAQWRDEVRDRMTVKTARRSNILDVSYRSRDPQAAAAVVTAVVQSYLDFVRATQQGTAGDIVASLAQEKARLEQQLAGQEAKVLELRHRVGHLGLRGDEARVHPLVQRALSLNDAVIAAQERRLEMQALSGMIDAAVANGEDLCQLAATVAERTGDTGVLRELGVESQDARARAEEQALLANLQGELVTLQRSLGPAHPRVVSLQTRVQAAEAHLAEKSAQPRQRLAEVRDSQVVPLLKQVVEQRVGEAWKREQTMRSVFDKVNAEAVELNDHLAQLEIAEHNLRAHRDLHDALVNRIASVDVQRVQGDIRTAVVSPASPPEQHAWPSLPMVAVASVAAGLGLGLGLIWGLEALDDRWQRPEDLAEELRAPLLAHFGSCSVGTLLRQDESTRQVVCEARALRPFLACRAALPLASARASIVAAVDLAAPDTGAAAATGLALACAQEGERTLLVEFDPQPHGPANALGVNDDTPSAADRSPADRQTLTDRIRASQIERLDLLPLVRGRRAALEPAVEVLADVLEGAAARYDRIVVGGGPISHGEGGEGLVSLADATLLIVDPRRPGRRETRAAVGRLRATGAIVAGVALRGSTLGAARIPEEEGEPAAGDDDAPAAVLEFASRSLSHTPASDAAPDGDRARIAREPLRRAS